MQEPEHEADDAPEENGQEEKHSYWRHQLDGHQEYAGYGNQANGMACEQTDSGETEGLNVADVEFGPGQKSPCAAEFRQTRANHIAIIC